MFKKIKKYQRSFLVGVIVICMGIIMAGGIRYIVTLRHNLQNNAIQNVMTVTKQQQQAFDTFIAEDQKRLHSYAEYFAQDSSVEDVPQQILMLNESDAIYSVMCLDDGWFCSSVTEKIRQVEDEEKLAYYHSLTGSGVRDSFIGIFSGDPKFAYYETFTFSNGHRGLIQKTYERAKVSETFSLSFYNDQGLSHVVNEDGDILLRPAGITENLYDNIFDAISERHGQQEKIDHFKEALHNRETGSMIFSREGGELVYTYVPMENVEGWYLVSVVSLNTIRAETDQMLQNSQITLGILVLVLVVCAVFILLIWRTHKEIEGKEQEAEYQTQMFDVFATYLSRNTDDVYFMYDHETEELEYVSPNVERVLGVGAEGVKDYFWESDLSADPEGTAVYYAEVQALTPGNSARSRYTERINPKTGEHKYFQENAYCTNIQGRNKRVAYLSDRTRERKDRNSLAEALQMAETANEAKSAFLSNVSHDIRTPMNAITGFLSLMRDEVNNPGIMLEYIQRIEAASQHLLGLINDVLDMNKIESGSTTLSISEMNLAEVIDEINTIIRSQAKAKGQTFDIFVSHLVYEHLLGDKMRINQILINLLSNAVKYTGENGKIEMRVEELPQVVSNYSRVRFTVSDNGLGMSESYLKVIFDPFTREETKTVREIQGTGLGMAITKRLVDLMGGTIHVESAPGKGSSFTVELELRIQERAVQEEDAGFWEKYGLTRMIVADDDEQVCQNIVKTMAKTGVVTDYVTDGKAVVQKICSAREAGKPYDLVLLDWKMPTLDGLEATRLIRKYYSDKIPVILLTAYDWSEIEQEAIEIGINHYMPKPFFMSNFKEAIRRVTGSTEKKEENRSDVFQNKHILVVDDIEVNRIILTKILSTLGASCDTASNGKEAVEKFVSTEPGKYDLILMDVQMTVMNGYDATKAIRSSDHPQAGTIPIIAMTANAFVDDVRDAIESGMDGHIAKPVQLDNLKTTVGQVLDKRAEQAKNEKRKDME
ncbi:MAG: response regulator [Lachnospiraceae bacterium]|nr:response regulator [Lachnospiraceae bacterium]